MIRSVCTIPEMSCALQGTLTLLFFGVIGDHTELLVIMSEVSVIWCGSPVMPRFWIVLPKLIHQ